MIDKNGKYGLQTRSIHAGETPDPSTHASAPNIVMSTTFVVDDASAQFSANALGEDAPFVYTRWGNPTVNQLEAKLANLEGGEAAVAFGSGMAAATAFSKVFSKVSESLDQGNVDYRTFRDLSAAQW
jgi:O-acetylhomoserine/O-acetylserine sulfhydrylase-like pyridoxal-dependent enzyme